jgi:broad specificity phosphatase PhoE
MPAPRLHFVRHGEVFNPQKVLYGRIPGFGLSELGHQMAKAAAETLKRQGVNVEKLIVSPLQRTRESAAPWQELFGLTATEEDRIIEPWNQFEGYPMGYRSLLSRPALAVRLYNPMKPSWGEPFSQIQKRMQEAALHHAADSSADVVFVSHQLPIEMLYRSASGLSLAHNPRQRRTTLSSITSFEIRDGKLVEVDYQEPGMEIKRKLEVGA